MEDSFFMNNSWREGRRIFDLGEVVDGLREMFKMLDSIAAN